MTGTPRPLPEKDDRVWCSDIASLPVREFYALLHRAIVAGRCSLAIWMLDERVAQGVFGKPLGPE